MENEDKVLNEVFNVFIDVVVNNEEIYTENMLIEKTKFYYYDKKIMFMIREQYCDNFYNIRQYHLYKNNTQYLKESGTLREKVTFVFQTLFINNERLIKQCYERNNMKGVTNHLRIRNFYKPYAYRIMKDFF